MQIQIRDYKHQQKLVKISYIFIEVKPHPFSFERDIHPKQRYTFLDFCSALKYWNENELEINTK